MNFNNSVRKFVHKKCHWFLWIILMHLLIRSQLFCFIRHLYKTLWYKCHWFGGNIELVRMHLNVCYWNYAESFPTRQFKSLTMNKKYSNLSLCWLLPLIVILFPEQLLDQLEGRLSQARHYFEPLDIMPPHILKDQETLQRLLKHVLHMV